jgi:hypothetical protein
MVTPTKIYNISGYVFKPISSIDSSKNHTYKIML